MTSNLLSLAIASAPLLGSQQMIPRLARLDDLFTKNADQFFVIERGAVRLFVTGSDGKRFFLNILSSGEIFTPEISSLIRGGHVQIGLEAIKEVTLRQIPRASWQEFCERHAQLQRCVMHQELERLQIVHFHLTQHCKRGSIDRARFALWSYARSLGVASACGSVAIRVSRTELADCVGVSSDRVTRLIRQLQDRGEIKTEGRSIIIGNELLCGMISRLPLRRNANLAPVAI